MTRTRQLLALVVLALASSSVALAAEAQVAATIVETPLEIAFSHAGYPLTALVGFSMTSAAGRVGLAGPPVERRDGEGTELEYRMADGRSAFVVVGPAGQGASRVRFSVSEKGEFERLAVAFQVAPDEGFYGLMERVVQGSQAASWKPGLSQGLNLRGQTVDLYLFPTVSVYGPFYVSSKGYGVYVESDWPGTYRFGVDSTGKSTPTELSIEYEGPELALRVLPGPSPLDAVQRYARTVGMPLLVPRWACGPFRWRDECWDLPAFSDGSPYAGPYNSMVVEDVLMMEALGIPCSAYIVDRPWAEGSFGYGDRVPDSTRFPDFDRMVGWLEKRGIRPLLWAAPWVMDAMRAAAVERGYIVTNTIPYLPQAANIDFTNPDAVSWWQDALVAFLESGIAGFKLDRGEEKNPDGLLFQGTYADGTSYREGHNPYPVWFAKAAYGALERAGVADRAVNLVRAGWVGTSSVAIVWGGDTDPSEWGLRSAIIAVQRAALLNFPFWGSDTGGYNARPPREVLARWLAFSAFTPLMEVGPMANLAPWCWLPDGSSETVSASGYPAGLVYDSELLAVWHLYANLHQDLSGYTYQWAQQAHEQGTPIVRPMVAAYPDRPEYRDLFEQYLYGPDLLVRPIWKAGASRVDVFIPDGTWVDAWTGRAIVGPTVVTADTPLHVIPVYVRAGGSIALGDLGGRWAKAQKATAARPSLSILFRSIR